MHLVPALLALVPAGEDVAVCPGDRWPAFRGAGTSHSAAADLPLEWSAERNVAWTAELVGYGQSSPVVIGGRVFVTSVDGPRKERCYVSCYDLAGGTLLWSRSFRASVEIEHTETVSRAAPTPAVDGERIVAFFESGDLVALDHEGETLWKRSLTADYGPYGGRHGVGTSVVPADDAVVLLLDHEGPSYLVKIDKATGRNVWKVDREPRVSWSTPAIARIAGGDEVVLSSNGVVEGFALADGARRWFLDGVGGNTVPSPTIAGDRVVVGSSEVEGNLALERPAPDDSAPSTSSAERRARVRWRADGARPSGFGSPLVHGGRVFLVNKSGALSCLDLESGALAWTHRLDESCWTSPLAAGERLYFFGKSGTTTVLAARADGPEVLATNALPVADVLYGVAAVDGAFLLREGRRLHCVRAGATQEP